MKNLKHSLRIAAVLAATAFCSQTLQAAPNTWNNAAGGNWSVGGNWSTLTAPGIADDVIFGNVGAGTTTTMDASRTVDSLSYSQDNNGTHTTIISPGQTLTIQRTTGGSALSVGSTSGATTSTSVLPVTLQGPGGTLVINSPTNDLVVRQGNTTAGAHSSTLDMSALDTFNATIGHLLVGQALSTEPSSVNRPCGILFLAKTNTITVMGATNGNTMVSVMVADGASNAGNQSFLHFGQATTLNADNLRLGGQKSSGTIDFNPAFSAPTLVIRGSNGVSRAGLFIVADNSIVNSGSSSTATMDLSAGSVDILADTVQIARGNPGPLTGTDTATVTIGSGIFDANTLVIANQIASGANGTTTGTLNVNNSGIFTTGAVVRVNSALTLAHTNNGVVSGAGATTATLNITGGTVLANSIVAGGGSSTINLTSGSLVISNTAGSSASPIKSFVASSSTLILPALNGGGVLFVSSLSGSGNTLTVSSIPPIAAYPVTFTLISYQTGSAGIFTLNPLPPGYAGTLLDTGNGVVQLQLTSGPIANLSLLWTGAANNSWDGSSINWLFQGNPTNFFVSGAPLFNDSSVQTNITIATSVAPSAVVISNNTGVYDFSGPGGITGAASLTKKGTQTAILENQGLNSIGAVTISGGTLQLGAGSTNGDLSTPNITNNAAFVVNRSGIPVLAAAITGSGTLTKLGNGTLTLSGANTFTGVTTLSGGGLEVDGTQADAVNTASGTVLSGGGTISGLVTVGGQLNPGLVNGLGTLTAQGGLTLSTGSTLTFDLDATGATPSDTIAVTGDLHANNNTVAANFLGVPQVGLSYPVISYSGTLFGSFNPTVTGTHFTVALDSVSSPGIVSLSVTGGSGANLKWSSAVNGNWDSTTTNWTDLNTSAPSLFFSGDNVQLDDTAPNPAITIPAGISVYPTVVSNISDGNNFTISGSGKISGAANIVKAGLSTLTISTANDYTGTVDIQAGVLKLGNALALGNAGTGTTIESNATLDLSGLSVGGEVLTASGPGAGGVGAIISSGSSQIQSFRTLVMVGDTSLGGSAMWAMNNAGGAASISTGGQPFKLTKVGANLVSIENVASIDAALGDIEVQQGTLEFNGLTPNMGDPAHTNYVDSGATLQFTANSVGFWNKFFNLTGNGTTTTVNNNGSTSTELAGPVEIHGAPVFNAAGTLFMISSVVSGDGSFTKTGASALILSNNNTYTGDTLIKVGALRLAGNASISNSPNIVISAGATLTVTGRVDATFTLLNSQTLSGSGVINGNLTAAPGSTITPGTVGTTGFLTVSNNIILGGTIAMDLNQDTATNDLLRCNSAITYGGTLSLNNIGSSFTNGASFKIFNAATYSGFFSTVTPAIPAPGQTWNTNLLTTSGIISIVSTVTGPTTNASITKVSVSGTNMVIHGTNNNVPNTSFHYVVLSTPNLTNALSNWTPIVTNPFNANGTFDYTNPIVPGVPRQFLDVKAVP